MKRRYTDFVLTVIALCLVVLATRAVFEAPVAHAAPGPISESARAEQGRVVPVNLVQIGGWELLSRSALPVEIESGPVPVEIQRGAFGCGCP